MVNVIIVDFRAFDTLGEITVLAIAAIIISALLRAAGRAIADRSVARAARPRRAGHPLMLALVARLLLPFAVLVAVFLFLRGHNDRAEASSPGSCWRSD